ncbi:hypothetical protein [Pseudarthrobacter sp. PH31-O2]|nr:hypothetical protein [Pseudarthrobacter sp. PH31-O2]MDJ0354313.1 hypothetical protein [Pseudarthrobacter sp. PH31-O2]
MSETLDPMATDVDQQELAQQLLAQAREQGTRSPSPSKEESIKCQPRFHR